MEIIITAIIGLAIAMGVLYYADRKKRKIKLEDVLDKFPNGKDKK